jgi:deoxyribodipyrimidine photo-lyase
MYIPEINDLLNQPTPVALFWLRRDLRLTDNHGLYQALKHQERVLCLFIFDTAILETLPNSADRRVNFIYQQIKYIKQLLEAQGSSLLVCYGKPTEIYSALMAKYPIQAVYANHDYEPYARQRDQDIQDILATKQIPFYTFKDHVIFEKDEILKEDSTPYSVFTAYMKKWKELFNPELVQSFDTAAYYHHFLSLTTLPLISLADIGFQNQPYTFPLPKINLSLIKQYDKTRDIPSLLGTSRLGIHLRFGTLSIREATRIAQEHNATWLNELIWRNFYITILWHFPHVVHRPFKPAYDKIAWSNNEAHFQAWCKGETGYAIVDAGMQELNQTGYMHNRLRMITASFLVKNLLIDWRLGEAYFAQNLLDYELASNNGNWQWVAGSGCDAAPYFRIFNPILQTKKFDPALTYIKRWNPQFQSLNYPKPIIAYQSSREKTLQTYQDALINKS